MRFSHLQKTVHTTQNDPRNCRVEYNCKIFDILRKIKSFPSDFRTHAVPMNCIALRVLFLQYTYELYTISSNHLPENTHSLRTGRADPNTFFSNQKRSNGVEGGWLYTRHSRTLVGGWVGDGRGERNECRTPLSNARLSCEPRCNVKFPFANGFFFYCSVFETIFSRNPMMKQTEQITYTVTDTEWTSPGSRLKNLRSK